MVSVLTFMLSVLVSGADAVRSSFWSSFLGTLRSLERASSMGQEGTFSLS